MTGSNEGLQGAKILILEDDYYLATDLQNALEVAGATVIGPFPDEDEASFALERERPDCAFVDVNLGKGPTFDFPKELARRAVPFAFVTGYDPETIPAEFEAVERFEKPIERRQILTIAHRLLTTT